MDSDAAPPTAAAIGEGVGLRITDQFLFGRSKIGIGNGGLGSVPTTGWTRGPKPLRHSRYPVLLVIGACCLGLLAYGASSQFGGERPGSKTYKFTLPPARSAAAVEALPAPNLLKPLSPDEASKENSERPFASRTDSPASRFLLETDGQDRTRALTCLAQAVYYEAAGEGVDGQRAVAQVVLNRVHHPGFPSTICGVIYEGSDRAIGCQFSFTCDGSMQHIPEQRLWARSKVIAQDALMGRVFTAVGHATHYHADYVLPYWADSLDKSIQIGRHIFYRLRSSLGDARAFSQQYRGSEPPFREPGAMVVIPQTAENQQLAHALIGNGAPDETKDAEKASPQSASPLRADSVHAVLVADEGSVLAQTHVRKSSGECKTDEEHRQLAPIRADDVRSSSIHPC